MLLKKRKKQLCPNLMNLYAQTEKIGGKREGKREES